MDATSTPQVGQTISAADFSKMAGAPQANSFANLQFGVTPTAANPPSLVQKISSLGGRVMNSATNALGGAADEAEAAIQGKESPIAAASGAFSDLAHPILKTANLPFEPIEKGVNDVFTGINKAVGTEGINQQGQQQLAQGQQQFAQAHPEAAKILGGLGSAAGLGAAAAGGQEAIEGAPEAINAVKDTVNNTVNKVADVGNSITGLSGIFKSEPEEEPEGINLKQQAVARAEQDLAEAKQNAANPKDINAKQSALLRAQQDLAESSKQVPEATSKLTAAQQAAKDTEVKLAQAAKERGEAAPKAVNAYEDTVQKVTGNKSVLGQQFAKGAQKIETANPNLKLDLSNDQISALRDLKESKSFSLPKSVDQTESNQAFVGGKAIGGNLQAKINEALGNVGKETNTSLTPTETQELISQLNRGTYSRGADGALHVNQQMVDLTNEIKSQASQTFGKDWDKLYSNYAQGINAVNKLDDIVNLSKDATASDANKSIAVIQKLSKTPEGKVILQNAIEDYKNVTKATTGKAIDLSDHVSAIQRVQELQDAVEQHQAALDANQKDIVQAQKAVEKAKADVAAAQRSVDIANEAHQGHISKVNSDAQEAVKRAQRRLDIANENLQAQQEEKAALEKAKANRSFLQKHPTAAYGLRRAAFVPASVGIYAAIKAISNAAKK